MENNNKTIHNQIAHDKAVKFYNIKHNEIYNRYEQERLRQLIAKLNGAAQTKVLDVGAGTGNLTLKFLELGCEVTALDVSAKSLDHLYDLSGRNPRLNLITHQDQHLPFDTDSFDVVCTYSVLHHIPDYLFTVNEMIRVTSNSGLLYIDHEANQNRYRPDACLKEYYKLTKQTRLEHIKKLLKTRELFTFDFLKTVFIKLLINKKYEREGDIHVWEDDHIEWNRIKDVLIKSNCDIIAEVDYLMFKPKGGIILYEKYKDITSDTKYVVAKKNLV